MPDFFTRDLFENVLVEPIRKGYEDLKIISGYASPLMVTRHVQYLKEVDLYDESLNISLIIGMAARDGLEKSVHKGFVNISNDIGLGTFQCRYVNSRPAVHSKVYIWDDDQAPKIYLGSANYSQTAFSDTTAEILGEINNGEILKYYDEVYDNTIDCRDLAEDDEVIELYDRDDISRLINPEAEENILLESVRGLESVNLPLTKKDGGIPERSGINWGQRAGREPNQAYIPIPAHIQRSDFFPERGEQFLVITDDGKEFICVRAQDNGKALETTLNNSLLGEYLRNRLGVANGEFVEKADLLEYGRTDVELYKIDNETFLMNFGVTDG